MRFLPIVTQIFLWGAVFAGMESRPTAAASRSPATPTDDIIAYYLLTMIGRAFSSMPGLASGIARDIRDGTVKKYLIQPIDMLGFLLLDRVGPQAGLLQRGGGAVRAGVLPLPRLLSRLARRRRRWRPSSLSLVLSFLLGFFLEATLGMIGFWFLEVSSLLFVYMLMSFFFSGHMFPLDMLPGGWGDGGEADPAAIPGLFSRRRVPGQGHGAELVRGPVRSRRPGWCFFLSAAADWRSTTASRRYSGFGG